MGDQLRLQYQRGLARRSVFQRITLKTRKTVFTKSGQIHIPLKLTTLAISGKFIERTTSIKFLVILLDKNLSRKNHISFIENKISKKKKGILFKTKNIVNKDGLKTLYFFCA